MSATKWRPVPNFEGLYEISQAGNIRSAKNKRRMAREPSGRTRAYRRVSLWPQGRRKHLQVHRLVAEAFHGPAPSKDHIVCHKDDIGHHNHKDNLYWGTRDDNEADRWLNSKAGRLALASMEEPPF